MLDCLELLGEIVAIFPIKKGVLDFDIPFNVPVAKMMAANIKVNGSVFTDSWLKSQRGIILDGYYINNVHEGNIIMEPGASVKETPNVASSGIFYNTKVTSSTYDDIEKIRSFVCAVQQMASFDTFIVDDMDRVFVLRSEEPACFIRMNATLPVKNTQGIDVEVVSVSGLIPIDLAE